MTSKNSPVPVVMVFSGNDPSGGAGIQADIEALLSHGCHTSPVITALTIQDTQDVLGYTPLDGDLIIEQARAVLEDMPISAFKLGLLPTTETVEAIHSILADYPEIPVSVASTQTALLTGAWRSVRPVLTERRAPCSAGCPASTSRRCAG